MATQINEDVKKINNTYMTEANAPVGSAQYAKNIANNASAPVALPAAISADSLQPATPITLPIPKTDTTNYSGIVANGNATIDALSKSAAAAAPTAETSAVDLFKQYLGSSEAPANPYDSYANLEGQYGIADKTAAAAASKAKVDALSAKLAGINAEAEAAKIGLENQTFQGQGIDSAAFLGRQQAETSRKAALRALPVQAELLAAQAVATNDSTLLSLAQDKVNKVFEIQSTYATNLFNYKKDLRDKVYDFATKEQKAKLDVQAKKDEQEFTLLRDNLGNAQNIAKTALENGAADIAAKITALDPKSSTYADDLAALQAKIPADPNKALDIQYKKAQISKIYSDMAGTDGAGTDNIVDPASASILAQTGLSMPAFQYLTTGTAALTRMTAAQRKKYMDEAATWANKNGIDLSTFKSQYSALSKTVEANVLRNNQSAVAEAELDATLNNLSVAGDDASFGKMKWANVAKLFAGKEFNDENVSKYSFHLNQLREEFAMYNAALAGQIDANGNIRQINEADYKKAENIIKDGFAKGSIVGFQAALKASREKMQTVLQSSISAQNKQVWKLFGVEGNYESSKATNSGTTLMTGPDGVAYNVPNKNVDAFIKAGGKKQ